MGGMAGIQTQDAWNTQSPVSGTSAVFALLPGVDEPSQLWPLT